MELSKERSLDLVDLVYLLVVTVSAISVAALALGIFSAVHVLILGFLTAGLVVWGFRFRLSARVKGVPPIIFLIVLAALFFRVQPYLYVPGGQDQGVYMNIAAVFERGGSTQIRDDIRAGLDGELLQYYDRANQSLILPPSERVEGKYEGVHIAGVYIKNLEKSQYVFQFYPLHPLWIGIFGNLFGKENGAYSLVFFSLLSIISFYLLAKEITKHEAPAVLISLFLAVHPLHAFFSKFPVTEILVLSYSSASFFYLARFYRESVEATPKTMDLVLSAGLMGCLFFTRITGFLYAAFYLALLIVAIVAIPKKDMRTRLIAYCFGVLLIYAFSVIFGMKYSFPYSHDIYKYSFGSLGDDWQGRLALMLIILSVMVAATCAVGRRVESRNRFAKLLRRGSSLLPYLFPVIILLSLYKAYQLGFTDKYLGHFLIDKTFHMTRRGLSSFAFSNIFVAFLHLSPPGFVVFFGGAVYIGRKKHDSPLFIFLMLFLLIFWSAGTVISFATPYQYYYARYLMSEVIPYSLLLIAAVLGSAFASGKRCTRAVSAVVVLMMTLYFSYWTIQQLRGREADGAYASLSRVEDVVKKNDLLLLDKSDFVYYNEIKTPLSYFYGLNVFTIESAQDLDILFRGQIMLYDRLFLLSQHPVEHELIQLVDTFDYEQGSFEHTSLIPVKFAVLTRPLFLYRVNRAEFRAKKFIFSPARSPDKLVNFHADLLWTKGDSTIKDLSYSVKPNDTLLVIQTKGYNPERDLQRLQLRVYTNDKELEFSHRDEKAYYFKLSPRISTIRKIRIMSSTFVPRDLKINEDKRKLGIDIKLITIE